MTNILAFDQSSTHVGYAIFEDTKLTVWGEMEADAPNYDYLRLWTKDVIKEYAIDTVVVENIYLAFYTKNNGQLTAQAQVFKVLATVRAHIWAASRDMKCDVFEVSAYHAMKALTGINKVATKREVRKAAMIEGALKLTGELVSDHVADSIGIGVAYLSNP